jgi:hypothetical protein
VTRPRDSQRSRVYRWEKTIEPEGRQLDLLERRWASPHAQASNLFWTPTLTFDECKLTISRVLKREANWIVSVEKGRGCAAYGRHTIRLSKWGYCLPVCLHEAAHVIVNLRFGWGAASHGPEFMGVFIFLLVK